MKQSLNPAVMAVIIVVVVAIVAFIVIKSSLHPRAATAMRCGKSTIRAGAAPVLRLIRLQVPDQAVDIIPLWADIRVHQAVNRSHLTLAETRPLSLLPSVTVLQCP